MNPFGMSAGEIPDDAMDRSYDAETVFKNFASDTRTQFHARREVAPRTRREFVVEVRKSKRRLREGV